jgi:TRAP transporter 4TM/12TM fusion protein
MRPWFQDMVRRISYTTSVLFILVVVLFAAQGVMQEFVHWITPIITPDFDEMPRRLQRLAYREGLFGSVLQFLKLYFFSKTAIFLGVPILASYCIVLLNELALEQTSKQRFITWGLLVGSLVVFGYWIISVWLRDNALVYEPKVIDFILFPTAILIALILTKQYFGTFITGFTIFWIIYLFIKGLLPEALPVFGSGASHNSFIQNYTFITQAFWVDTGGLFGTPLQVVSRNVLIFIVFGAVLMACGAGGLLLKLANIATGRLIGGAAHAAVASSAMFGTVSGAAISNVVSTGVMTIPVIKKAGFKPAFAGAVEAAASTGGQVVPPVMGVVAFFVAAQIGLDYRYIMVAAITPAILYYIGVFMTVYLEARAQGIGALPEADIPRLTRLEKWQTLVFIIPLSVLTYFLVTQPSITKAGFYGFLAALTMALILFADFRKVRCVLDALEQAGQMAAKILIIVAIIGFIIGLLNVSGFNGRLALFLTELATGPLFFVLIVVALGAIVLGMGLPPGATYFIIVIALSSGIDAVAVPALSLHLFVVFFAVMSTVTPPVALAAFAAAPIAGADPIRTSWQASRLALGGFIIPFMFVYHPAILYKLQVVFEWISGEAVNNASMIDISLVGWLEYGWAILAFCFAIWLLATALTGFEVGRLGRFQRAFRVLTGIAVLVPKLTIATPALIIAGGLIVSHRLLVKRRTA